MDRKLNNLDDTGTFEKPKSVSSKAKPKTSAAKKGTKKRPAAKKPKRKPKKPKVQLAAKKVYILSGIICLICVLALIFSIIINSASKNSAVSDNSDISAASENKEIQKTEKEDNSGTLTKPNDSKGSKDNKEKTVEHKVKADGIIEKKSVQSQKKAAPEEKVHADADREKTDSVAKKAPPAAVPPSAAAPVKNTEKKVQSKPAPLPPPKQTETKSFTEAAKPAVKSAEKKAEIRNVPQNVAKSGGGGQPSQKTVQKKNSEVTQKRQAESVKSQPTAAKIEPVKVAAVQRPSNEKLVPKSRFDIQPASNGATIVIIIDDGGKSAANVKRYTSLPFPITIAVLPKLQETRACAAAVRAAHQELILHQPMQAENLKMNPGPGAITAGMSNFEIREIVKQNLLELGDDVKGMNNHEGSLITADYSKIGTVLDVCSSEGIYFLDSRTTVKTQAPQAALARGMKIYEKAGPYIDNDLTREKMLERMYETLSYANRHGKAIVIGHVDKSVNILPDLLAEMYPYMKSAGYKFATPSQLR